MVKYICNVCLKEFKQKGHFIDHTERRKYPCKQNNTNSQKITEVNIKTPDLTENKNEHSCNKCKKSFVNIYSLKRHCDNYCKVKKAKKLFNFNIRYFKSINSSFLLILESFIFLFNYCYSIL